MNSRITRMFGLLVGLVMVAAIGATTSRDARAVIPPLPNTVQQWNKIAEDTVVGSGAFQGEGEIYMSYASAAVYDAVVAIRGGFEPYGPAITALPGASVDCAVVEAAYRTLKHYFSSFAALVTTLDGYYAEALSPSNLNGCTADAGKGTAVGLAAANSIIALRADDGRRTPVGTTSSFETKDAGPGVWRLTPPFAVPQTPWLGSVQPFLLKSPGQFQPEPPIPLSSREWVRQFDEVKAYGGATSSLRTLDQTATARFYTANVVRQFNRAARDLATARGSGSARYRAAVGHGQHRQRRRIDVGAECQVPVPLLASGDRDRPGSRVTADGFGPVPGFDDGNPATAEEPGWRPLVTTPNHPEYPAAHGTNTSAMAEVFTEFLGTDRIDLDIRGFDAAGAAGNLDAVHHFDTAEQLRDEVINARLWGGIHYRRSSEVGVHLGRKVAHYGLNHAFKATG